jgi:hypothetical protein
MHSPKGLYPPLSLPYKRTDNGIGLPDRHIHNADTYGMTLIQTIGKSAGWSASVKSPAASNADGRPGTAVTVQF